MKFDVRPYRRVGREIYPLLTDYQKAVVSHGMFPVEVSRLIEKHIRHRWASSAIKKLKLSPELLDSFADNVCRESLDRAMTEVFTGFLQKAREERALLV